MRAVILVAAATVALGVACYRTAEPKQEPVGSTRVTSADEGDTDKARSTTDFQDPWAKKDGGGAQEHPYDSDYDHPGQSPGITPPSSIPHAPMSRPAPWRGSSGGGSK